MIITVFTLTATASPYFTIRAAAGLPIVLRRSDVYLSTLKIILRLVEVVAEIHTSRYWHPNMSHSGSRETNKTKPLLMWRSKSHKNRWGCCASSLVPSQRQSSLYVCVFAVGKACVVETCQTDENGDVIWWCLRRTQLGPVTVLVKLGARYTSFC
jgi:hypothetical protein